MRYVGENKDVLLNQINAEWQWNMLIIFAPNEPVWLQLTQSHGASEQ